MFIRNTVRPLGDFVSPHHVTTEKVIMSPWA